MRASTSIERRTRHRLSLSAFRGVDFTSSPLTADAARATRAENFLYENGANRKRHGYRECLRLLDAAGRALPVGGCFAYGDGYVVTAGGRVFFARADADGVLGAADVTESAIYAPAKADPARLTDGITEGFFRGGRLYLIGCGDYLVYGDFGAGAELRRVYANDATYVPTTAISRNAEGESDPVRASLEGVNLLTPWRKNRLLGTTAEAAVWQLDGDHIDAATPVCVSVETTESVDGAAVPVTYTLDNRPASDPTGTPGAVLRLVAKSGGATPTAGASYGSIDAAAGTLSLSFATPPRIAGRDNITVTFSCTTEAHREMLPACRFGVLYGEGGGSDRLFLSGNPACPNRDFWSEPEDFSYFPAKNTASLGSERNPLTGYGRLLDGSMAVYARGGEGESGVYFRTGTYRTETDAESGAAVLYSVFPTLSGSSGEGALSPHTCADLDGDALILTRTGVCGVVQRESGVGYARYLRERSRPVNAALCRHAHPENAVATVCDGRYYLALDNVCYVADGRYAFREEGARDGAFGYEWWYLTDLPIRCFCRIGGALAFGTEDGRLCAFDDGYSDRTRERYGAGEISVSYETSRLLCAGAADLSAGDEVRLGGGPLYAALLTDATVENDAVVCPDGLPENLREGDSVWVDEAGASGLPTDVPVRVGDIDRGRDRLTLCSAADDQFGPADTFAPTGGHWQAGRLTFADGVFEPFTAALGAWAVLPGDAGDEGGLPLHGGLYTGSAGTDTDTDTAADTDSAADGSDTAADTGTEAEPAAGPTEDTPAGARLCLSEEIGSCTALAYTAPRDGVLAFALPVAAAPVASLDFALFHSGEPIRPSEAMTDENAAAVRSGWHRITPQHSDTDTLLLGQRVRVAAGDRLYFCFDYVGGKDVQAVFRPTVHYVYAAGEPFPLPAGGFRLLRSLSRATLYVAESDAEGFSLRAFPAGAPLTLCRRGGAAVTDLTAEVFHARPVKALWETPLFDLGDCDRAKNLHAVTVVCDPMGGGRVRFGYETRRTRRTRDAEGAGRFSLSHVSFEDFSFDTGFVTAYTARVAERNFNYIRFRLSSEEDAPCVLHRLTATYTYQYTNKGVS